MATVSARPSIGVSPEMYDGAGVSANSVGHWESSRVGPARVEAAPRRRGSMQQGRALETLGHAVEYLVDSRLFLVDGVDARASQDALQILMKLSRAVFAECPEVVTLWSRVGRLCRRSFARR